MLSNSPLESIHLRSVSELGVDLLADIDDPFMSRLLGMHGMRLQEIFIHAYFSIGPDMIVQICQSCPHLRLLDAAVSIDTLGPSMFRSISFVHFCVIDDLLVVPVCLYCALAYSERTLY
jgi:hypothetical protein